MREVQIGGNLPAVSASIAYFPQLRSICHGGNADFPIYDVSQSVCRGPRRDL